MQTAHVWFYEEQWRETVTVYFFMTITIHQPQFMPWIGYFHKMASADHFVVLDDVQFKKNEWQHRNRIGNPNGWQWISVPNKYRFPQQINEVMIEEDQKWRKKHVRALEFSYSKADYFKWLWPHILDFYEQEYPNLADLNLASVKMLAKAAGIETGITRSSELHLSTQSTDRLINICRHFGASVYLAGAGAKDYMDFNSFEYAGVEVRTQDFTCPRYHQIWAKGLESFEPGLSFIDMLFNCGPNTLEILLAGKT